MIKKLGALILTITVIAANLAGCGNLNTGADTQTDGDAKSIDHADIDTSEHVVITYLTIGNEPAGTRKNYDEMMKELNKLLTEKCNAELEIYFIPWTDYLANYDFTLSAMDGTIDLVGASADWLDAWPNAKNGAFLPLSEDMLKKYAPKTWESVFKEHWDMCRYDGEIYMMPEDNYEQWINHGFIYRLDWAREAGLTGGVNSWEDMTEYFRYVRKAYPDIIPWDSDGTQYLQLASGWIQSHSDYIPVNDLSAGAMWGGSKENLYTVYSPFVTDTDSLVEFAKMMKEWDSMGVWNTENFNDNENSSNCNDYRIGLVAAEQNHTNTWTDLVSHTQDNKIYDEDPGAETGFFYFGEESENIVSLSVTHGAMAVSAGSRNPERALMVYDLLRNDPDCYRLMCYGIKGVSWDTNDEGLRIKPEGYNSETDNIGGTTNFWWGRNDDLEIKDAGRDWEKIDELYAEYDSIKIDYPYGQFVADVDNIQAQINNINDIHVNFMKRIAYGKYEGSARDIVAEYQRQLKAAGIDEVAAELQRQFDEFYK